MIVAMQIKSAILIVQSQEKKIILNVDWKNSNGVTVSRKEAKLFVARRCVRTWDARFESRQKKLFPEGLVPRGGVFNGERGETLKIAMRAAGCAGTKKISATKGSCACTCGGKLSLISSCRVR